MYHRRTAATFVTGAAALLLLSACSSAATQDPSPAATATGTAVGTGSSASSAPTAQATEVLASSGGNLDVTLTAAESQVPYQDGTRWAMTYNGGSQGPTLRVHPGDTLNVTLVNDLNEPTSLHTHGLHVSPDGSSDNPFVTVEPGQTTTYTYQIPSDQPGGTFWYHPHAHGMAAEQVASGLSGAIVVEDSVDDALNKVTSDNVLMVTDPPLASENPWTDGAGSDAGNGGMMDGSGMGNMMGGSGGVDMMTQMVGRSGPRLLTNGQDGVTLDGPAGTLEKVRIVNATASTRLNLTWTGAAMDQLASEGGRLAAPTPVTSVELAPGERTELVLVPDSGGGQLIAQRLSNEGSGGPIGDPEVVATVGANAGTDTSVLPATLATTKDLYAADVPIAQRRVITLEGHMNPTIDGQPFDPNTINFEAKKGTVEEWVIRNKTPMYHPIHLHSWPFQVQGQAGWQDVVQVAPYTEQVIRVSYDDFGGTTVLHCHILDHEDTGMMAIIKVQ
jgi:FtsP/CotA-like multicopper oxidase with cupredoxin domain